jgi:hypothetical protein
VNYKEYNVNINMNLVYFVVGVDPNYIKLTEYCINTIRCYTDNDKHDIIVMCDADYAHNLKGVPVKIHITPPNTTAMQTSMRKTEIFSVPGIEKYDKFLYLDSDIVVSGALDTIFSAVNDPKKLYVKPDGGNHTDIWWSRIDAPYDTETLKRFKEHNIYSFNCGQFAFKNSPEMRRHFDNVVQEMKSVFDPRIHFYEQVFMNNYFCLNEAILYDISPTCRVFTLNEPHEVTSAIVNHFANVNCHWTRKLAQMRMFHIKSIIGKDIPIIETRDHLYKILKVPLNPVIAEIGIFLGDFSKILLDTFNPSRLILVDPWLPEMICSGDQDGNDVAYYHGDDLYKHVVDKFTGEKRIQIQRKLSADANIEDASLDVLYIDGDHTYHGVVSDLERGHKWVKRGGWLCGHDFGMNPVKARHHYEFGVARAVHDFCQKYGYRIQWLAFDGCISFVIRHS